MARNTNQLTLSFLDTTSLSVGGLTLDAGYSKPQTPSSPPESADDYSTLVSPSTPAIPASNFHLAGERRLARGWKARAADNLASMRLALEIEEEKRNATADEQEILSRFTGFGASELANALFRRAGEIFSAGWEDIGDQLEQLVSRDELASLARSTPICPLHPGIRHPRDLARRPAHGLFRRPHSRARLRIGTFLRPYARTPSPVKPASPASRPMRQRRASPPSFIRTPGSGMKISPRRVWRRPTLSPSATRLMLRPNLCCRSVFRARLCGRLGALDAT